MPSARYQFFSIQQEMRSVPPTDIINYTTIAAIGNRPGEESSVNSFSTIQKAAFFDFLVELYQNHRMLDVKDIVTKVSPAFISNKDYRTAMVSPFNAAIVEAAILSREVQEDALGVYFVANLDNIVTQGWAGLGKTHRDAIQSIRWRLPHALRKNPRAIAACEAFENDFARVIVDFINSTPIRRGYSMKLSNHSIPFKEVAFYSSPKPNNAVLKLIRKNIIINWTTTIGDNVVEIPNDDVLWATVGEISSEEADEVMKALEEQTASETTIATARRCIAAASGSHVIASGSIPASSNRVNTSQAATSSSNVASKSVPASSNCVNTSEAATSSSNVASKSVPASSKHGTPSESAPASGDAVSVRRRRVDASKAAATTASDVIEEPDEVVIALATAVVSDSVLRIPDAAEEGTFYKLPSSQFRGVSVPPHLIAVPGYYMKSKDATVRNVAALKEDEPHRATKKNSFVMYVAAAIVFYVLFVLVPTSND